MPSPFSNPLLVWSVVAAVCALALAVEARLLYGLWRRAPKQRALRWFSLGLLVGSVAGILLAQQAYAAYQRYSTHVGSGGSVWAPVALCMGVCAQRAQAISLLPTLGWIFVGLTLALLVAGTVVLARTARRT
jgi:hypothetical protein